MTPSAKLFNKVDRMLKKAGFRFCRVENVGWKVYDNGIEYSWIEYQHSGERAAIKLSVDKLRDNAANFREVLTFHGLIIEI